MEESNLDILNNIAIGIGTTRASLVRILLKQQIEAYNKSGKDPAAFLGRKGK